MYFPSFSFIMYCERFFYSPLFELPNCWVEESTLIFSCENSKIITHCWTIINWRMLDLTKKKIPHVQGQRRSPSKTVGGEKSHLESNCNPPEMLRGLTRSTPGDPTETEIRPAFECLTVSCRGMGHYGLSHGQGLRLQQIWVWHKPSWRRSTIAPT